MNDQALIDQHLATKGVTRCPPAFVGVTESAHDAVVSAEDREAIRQHEEALRERQQMEWLVTTRSPKAVGPLADEIRASLRKRSEAGKAAHHRKQAVAAAARAEPTLTKSAASLAPTPRRRGPGKKKLQPELRLTAVPPSVAAARACGPERAAAQVGAPSVTEAVAEVVAEAAQTNAPPPNEPPAWQGRANAIVERLDGLAEDVRGVDGKVRFIIKRQTELAPPPAPPEDNAHLAALGRLADAVLKLERRMSEMRAEMNAMRASHAAPPPPPAPAAAPPAPRKSSGRSIWNPAWAVKPPKRK